MDPCTRKCQPKERFVLCEPTPIFRRVRSDCTPGRPWTSRPRRRARFAWRSPRAKEGDREALRLLYVRYSDNVYGYVRSIVRDDKEAEDLTQHVFMKLMTVIVKYDDRGVPFSGWLLRLARNAALDHLRRRRAIPAEEVYGADSHVDEDALDSARTCARA